MKTNILGTIKNTYYYVQLFFKARQFSKDIKKLIQEFPGIQDEDDFFTWCIRVTDTLVNFAAFTTFTTIDDYFAGLVRRLVVDHWNIIMKATRLIKTGNTIESAEVRVICNEICDAIKEDDEVGDPLLLVTIISIILNLIKIIQKAHNDNETIPDTDSTTDTGRNRPVVNLFRKILRRRK
jgi:hypothetical protein